MPEAAMLYPQQRHTGQPSSCWGWPILMPRVHHQLHMAHNLSPASILAEILSSGPTIIIMVPACTNESPAAVPQSSGVHVGPTAWFLAQKVQLHQPPLLLLISEDNNTTISFDSTSVSSEFQSSICKVLAPTATPAVVTTATPTASGAAPNPGAESRCRLLLPLSSGKYHHAAQVVARTPSAKSVVASPSLKHQPSDVSVAANAGDIVVVIPLYLKHQPSRRYEAKPSTAIKC